MDVKRRGGLGGMLRAHERLCPTVKVVGPPGLAHYLASLRFSIFRDAISLSVTEAPLVPDMEPHPAPLFQDTNLSVYGISISPKTYPEHPLDVPESDAGSSSEAHEWRMSIIDLMFPGSKTRKKSPGAFYQKLPKLSIPAPGLRPTIAYVAVGPEIRGKTMTRAVILILDVPSPSYIPSLLESFARSPFYSKIWSKNSKYTVRAVYHLCGKGVLEDKRYVEFMNGFKADTYHVISSPEYEPDAATFTTTAFHQLKMNRAVDPDVFAVPKFSFAAKKELTEISGIPANSVLLESGLHLSIWPANSQVIGFPERTADLFHPAAVASSTDLLNLSSGVLERIENLKDRVKAKESLFQTNFRSQPHAETVLEKYRRKDSVSIIPLGTAPNELAMFRNAPSTLIRIPGRGSVLLDAGEGTLGQLTRQFGTPGVSDVVRDLRCIFLSGRRWCSVSGVEAILAMRQQLDPPATEPLYLVGDPLARLHLKEVHQIDNLGIDDPSGNGVIPIISSAVHFFNHVGKDDTTGRLSKDGKEAEYVQSWKARAAMCHALGLRSFETCRVSSQHNCHAAILRHKDEWSIVYSSMKDTSPSRQLESAGRNATVLIHESTAANNSEDDTTIYSTIDQAIEVGERMKAKNVLLTHIPVDVPLLPERSIKPWVVFAFDHVNLTIGTLWKMCFYLPVVRQIFKEERYPRRTGTRFHADKM
ncbi:hypothetical protein FB451DRAFT_1270389 [Mycena latifolia]|nr:hypothetical protein FB451DRAFT_1270389 [Mycena latifolia]